MELVHVVSCSSFFVSYRQMMIFYTIKVIDLDNRYLSETEHIEIVVSKSSENIMLDSNESTSLVALVRM